MGKSNNERQATFRARQKQLDAVEPRLKLLSHELAEIQASDSLNSKLIALTIIGEILDSSVHGLAEISSDHFEELDETTIGAISDCLAFHENVKQQVMFKDGGGDADVSFPNVQSSALMSAEELFADSKNRYEKLEEKLAAYNQSEYAMAVSHFISLQNLKQLMFECSVEDNSLMEKTVVKFDELKRKFLSLDVSAKPFQDTGTWNIYRWDATSNDNYLDDENSAYWIVAKADVAEDYLLGCLEGAGYFSELLSLVPFERCSSRTEAIKFAKKICLFNDDSCDIIDTECYKIHVESKLVNYHAVVGRLGKLTCQVHSIFFDDNGMPIGRELGNGSNVINNLPLHNDDAASSDTTQVYPELMNVADALIIHRQMGGTW